MAKLKTLAEKQEIREKYVKASFLFMVLIPVAAVSLLIFGVDVSPVSGIIATASATFSALILGHLLSAPVDDRAR